MLKQEFLDALEKRLSGLPHKDVEERLAFYGEMIDDRIEEGKSEEDAVREIGSVEEIAEQILSEIPLARIAKEKIKPKRGLRAWEIVLLVLGAPLWLPVAVSALVVVVSAYAVVWSLIAAVWSVFASMIGGFVGGAIAGGVLIFQGSALSGLAIIGAGLVCAGLAVFLFFGCLSATKGVGKLTKKIVLGIKKSVVGREAA